MVLVEYHDVVNAVATDRANQHFGKTVLPRRGGRNRLVANPHRSQTTPDAIGPARARPIIGAWAEQKVVREIAVFLRTATGFECLLC